MLLRGPGGERWGSLEQALQGFGGQTSRLAALAWLCEGWPLEGERDAVRDVIWRALPEAAREDLGTGMRLLEAACECFLEAGVEPHAFARANMLAALVWLLRVSQGAMERASVEVIDGVVLPMRFSPAHPTRRPANDVSVAHMEIIAGQCTCDILARHEPGHWVARASMAPLRPHGVFKTWTGEQMQSTLESMGFGSDVLRPPPPLPADT